MTKTTFFHPVYPTQGIFLKLNSSDNPVAYGRAKNAKSDLTNLINAALTESQTGGAKGASPFPGTAVEAYGGGTHGQAGGSHAGASSSRFIFLKDKVGKGNYSLITGAPGGAAAGGKGRTLYLKSYNKDLTNLNREAAAVGDIPRVHLSRAEHESSQAFSPLPPFLSFNNNTPSLRTGMFTFEF